MDRDMLLKTHQKHCHQLLDEFDIVTAVDVNFDGKCIEVWVKPKCDSGKKEKVPKEIDGCRVDVIEKEAQLAVGAKWPDESELGEGKEEAAVKSDIKSVDRLKGGASIGVMDSKNVSSGTLGYFVKKGDKAVGVLTNAHVTEGIGTRISSPSKQDHGTKEDYIGTTRTAFAKTIKYDGKEYSVDCAFVPLRSGGLKKFEMKDGTVVTGTATAVPGDRYTFVGRTSTSSDSTGFIQSVVWVGDIRAPGDNKVKRFENQILLGKPSQPGDSGSLLLNEDKKAIGLVFADAGELGLANHIGPVLEALSVQLAMNNSL